jgi:hypothetical protein
LIKRKKRIEQGEERENRKKRIEQGGNSKRG